MAVGRLRLRTAVCSHQDRCAQQGLPMVSALFSCCYALQIILWVSASYSSTSSEPSGKVVWIFLALPT